MPISSPGLGSGLDVTGIVSQLMAIERQPLTRLNQKEAQVQAEISAYGALKGSLSSLQQSLSKLQQGNTFRATQAASTDGEVFSVSSDPDAVTSSYSVTVNRLAQQHKLGSTEFSSDTTFGGTAGDSLTLTVGTDSFTLDLSSAQTLSEIQQAINVESNGTGVTAGLITGDSGNQTLVLTSGESGFDNRIQLSYGGTMTAGSFGVSMLNRDSDDQLLASESTLDASLTVDGVAVTRSGNSISDVIEGLTLNLTGPGRASVAISPDTSVARAAVEGFVKAHNALKDQITSMGSSGASKSLLRSIESQLRGVLNNEVTGLGDFSYLSQLGLTSNSETGKLELDSEMLLASLQERPDSVAGFFSDEEAGFATRIDRVLEGFLESDGTIASMVQGANSRVDGIERNRDSMERRLESIELRYFKQFGALDTLMASLTTTSDYLASQLDALSNMIAGNNN